MLKNGQPRIELEIAKFFKKLGVSIVKFTKFLTDIPKTKEKRVFKMIELVLLFITLDLVLLAIIVTIYRILQ